MPKVSRDTLSPEELQAACRALSMEQKARLKLGAQWLVRWTPFDWKDLMHEAVKRAYAGVRKCPREISLVTFLSQTMRSIRSEWIGKWRREHDSPSRGPGTDAMNLVSEEDGHLMYRHATEDALSTPAHERLEWEDVISRARKKLSGDADALEYLRGLLNDWTRRECMLQFQWDTVRFETTRRRFNRRMAELGDELRTDNGRDTTEEPAR